MNTAVAEARLHNLRIGRPGPRSAAALVAWLGAMQAQEFPHARWALALRMPEGAADEALVRAFDRGRVLRTHVMRPTWHFVAPDDIRWLLELTGPRVQRRMAPYNRLLELDPPLLTRATATIERALGDDSFLTRRELAAALARAGMTLDTTRLAHVVMHAELEAVICSGPRRGRQFTYALLASRAPAAPRLPRDTALAELATRYFRSHGPATVRDFVWWSGLTTPDARRALEMIRARPWSADGLTYWSCGEARGRGSGRHGVHLLPVYDEYLVAYRDRHAVPHPSLPASHGRNAVIFQHAVVIDGQVAGTWRTSTSQADPRVEIVLLRRATRSERRGLIDAVERYQRFLGRSVLVSLR
jgi:hypothetical protein